MNIPRILVCAVGVVVVAVVGAGIVILDPPGVQRGHKQDMQRVGDLGDLAREIAAYWKEHQALPATIAALELPYLSDTDPASGTPYEYKPGKTSAYQLCASFALPSRREDDTRYVYPSSRQWRHEAGKICFSVDAAPKETCDE